MKLRYHIKIHVASFRMLLLFLSFYYNVTAQPQSVSNAGILYIHTGTTVAVSGSLINKAPAAFLNKGLFLLKGNLVNDELNMQAGSGTLQLAGTSLQTVSGTAPFNTFNLTTDNNSGIQLATDLKVNGQHRFVQGLISTADRYLIYGPLAYYTGASDQRHVNGWVRKQGTDNIIFPVGDSTYLRPVTLSQLTEYSEFDARYFHPTTDHTRVTYPLVAVNANEYWVINKNAGGKAQLTMNWDNARVVYPFTTLSDMRGSYYSGDSWQSLGGTAQGDVSTVGTMTLVDQGSFGSFAIGTIGALLPVRLIDLTASRVSQSTRIQWETKNETESVRHTVERSDDAVHFYAIGERAAQNNPQRSTYHFTDEQPLERTAWYRISILGRDGQTTRSTIVSVSEREEGLLRIYNDVVSGQVLVGTSALFAGRYTYQLYSGEGRLIQNGTVVLSEGITSLGLSRRPVPGVYMIRLSNGRFRFTRQLFFN